LTDRRVTFDENDPSPAGGLRGADDGGAVRSPRWWRRGGRGEDPATHHERRGGSTLVDLQKPL